MVPLQVYCWIGVPLAVAAARASTHVPFALLVSEYHAVSEMGSDGAGRRPLRRAT